MAGHPYGTKTDGTLVTAYTLQNSRLSAIILDMGGTITAIRVPDTQGQLRDVVLGLKDLAA